MAAGPATFSWATYKRRLEADSFLERKEANEYEETGEGRLLKLRKSLTGPMLRREAKSDRRRCEAPERLLLNVSPNTEEWARLYEAGTEKVTCFLAK